MECASSGRDICEDQVLKLKHWGAIHKPEKKSEQHNQRINT
jgi:hypothetical protein